MPILVDLFHRARKIPDSIDKPLLNYAIFFWGGGVIRMLFAVVSFPILSMSVLRAPCRPKPLQRANICRTVWGIARYFLAQLLAEFQLLTTECKIACKIVTACWLA